MIPTIVISILVGVLVHLEAYAAMAALLTFAGLLMVREAASHVVDALLYVTSEPEDDDE